MLRRVALVRTDVTEARIASIIRVTIFGELTTLEVTTNRRAKKYNVAPFLRNIGCYKSHTA
jgi:hypothetical protein